VVAGYYDETLAADRLERCYELAPPRVRRHLEAEIAHVLGFVRAGLRVLELGCGYGRVLARLVEAGAVVFGIDTSLASLALGRSSLDAVTLVAGDAGALPFADNRFDLVVCIQNGLSAFHRDPRRVLSEAVRVTRARGGRVLLSSYSERFWDQRLDWFRLQSASGLIGEIDEDRTGGGVIVCRDGFTATTVTRDDFDSLARELGVCARLTEVDGSSLFCEIRV